MTADLQAVIAHHVRTSEYWKNQPKSKIGEAFAKWLIMTVGRLILAQYTGGATMDYMAMMKALKSFVIAAGVEDDICQWAEKLVADSGNNLDDYVLDKIKEFWAAL